MKESNELTIELIIVFSCFLLVMGSSFFLLFSKYHKSLKLKQKEALNNLIVGQDNERERISRDLHDEMKPDLASLIHKIDEINSKEPNILEVKKQAKLTIKKIIQDIRRISHDLAPLILTKFGLSNSIQELIDTYKGKIKIEFTSNCEGKVFNDKTEAHLSKIIKELISNTKTHSQANLISIVLLYNFQKHELELAYSDNGIGFKKKDQKTSGIGLKNIVTRVGLMNGTIKIDGNKGFKAKIAVNTD